MRTKTGILILLLTMSLAGGRSYAFEPYRNYTYGSDFKPYAEPQAYIPEGTINGRSLGIGDFSGPSDLCIAQDGRICIADTGNDRIVILDASRHFIREIKKFANKNAEDGFNKPQGVFLTEDQGIFVADTDNKRIVQLDDEGNLLRIYPEPVIAVSTTNFEYKPIRVSVDKAGRLFIVSMNVNQGMIELDKEGNFISFFGATRVRASFADLLWKRILTQQQIDTGVLLLPTEYSSNDIDGEGFVFGTVSATGEGGGGGARSIRKLNPTGIDILRSTGLTDPMGDVNTIYENNSLVTSKLIDVCVGENGMYSVLDLQRGRVFTYDYDGNLLYIFGALGESLGSFSFPKALDSDAEHRFYVADGVLNEIIVFKPTAYAGMVDAAVRYQYGREYANAENEWKQILKYTANSDIAYIGMGKALLRQGSYQEAMSYLRLGSDRALYSRAFKEYRKELFNDSFGWIMTAVSAAAAAAVILRFVRKIRKTRKGGR